MKIPLSFQLFGQTIWVEMLDRLLENDDCVGQALYRKNLIQLQCSNRPTTNIEVTFCHEIVHWIFFVLSEDKLRQNEQLVDQIGRLLHQALSTMVYEEPS